MIGWISPQDRGTPHVISVIAQPLIALPVLIKAIISTAKHKEYSAAHGGGLHAKKLLHLI